MAQVTVKKTSNSTSIKYQKYNTSKNLIKDQRDESEIKSNIGLNKKKVDRDYDENERKLHKMMMEQNRQNFILRIGVGIIIALLVIICYIIWVDSVLLGFGIESKLLNTVTQLISNFAMLVLGYIFSENKRK